MTTKVHKKLARARDVCRGAGFLLQKLEAMYGADFGVGLAEQVRHAIRDCYQQASALMQAEAANAKEKEAMVEKRQENLQKGIK